MGAVFEATHTLLDKRVAVKVILPDAAKDEKLNARLATEARAASAIGHPNIASVTDMGRAPNGTLFVVMEFLEGTTFKDMLMDGAWMPVARAATLMHQVLGGLAVVHRKGIIHRDLKPENLMVVADENGEELVKILDFGISKIVAKDYSDPHLTKAGLVMGTPNYMSPEQASAEPSIDLRTDIYSSGAILYQLVTGAPPFCAETLSELIGAVLRGKIDPPSQRNTRIPKTFDRVLLRALARRPEDRYPDALAFREALQPFIEHRAAEPVGALSFEPGGDEPPAADESPLSLDESPLVSLDESALVSLDEVAPSAAPPAAAAPAAAAAPPAAASPGPPAGQLDIDDAAPEVVDLDARFAPPVDEARGLELEGEPVSRGPAPLSAAAPAANSPSTAERPKGASRANSPSGDLPRDAHASGVYGQARHRPPMRIGLWVGLALVVAGATAYYLYGRGEQKVTAPEAAARPERVTISFNVNPRFAELLVDGVLHPTTELVLNKDGREYTITVRARGYVTATRTVRAERDRTVQLELKKKPEEPPEQGGEPSE
jgi:serine/threonine-protein kinase